MYPQNRADIQDYVGTGGLRPSKNVITGAALHSTVPPAILSAESVPIGSRRLRFIKEFKVLLP
jgi:hypothetical protein